MYVKVLEIFLWWRFWFSVCVLHVCLRFCVVFVRLFARVFAWLLMLVCVTFNAAKRDVCVCGFDVCGSAGRVISKEEGDNSL